MTDREIMQQSLEALTCSGEDDDPGHRCTHCDDYVDRNGPLRAALRERLAQPEQEPVSSVVVRDGLPTLLKDRDIKPSDKRLYTAPPQRKPLKLREIEKCIYDANNDPIVACRNVEAAHGIKENT